MRQRKMCKGQQMKAITADSRGSCMNLLNADAAAAAAHCRYPAPLPPPPPLIARAGLAALRREASRELGTIAAPAVAHRPPSRRRLRIK